MPSNPNVRKFYNSEEVLDSPLFADLYLKLSLLSLADNTPSTSPTNILNERNNNDANSSTIEETKTAFLRKSIEYPTEYDYYIKLVSQMIEELKNWARIGNSNNNNKNETDKGNTMVKANTNWDPQAVNQILQFLRERGTIRG